MKQIKLGYKAGTDEEVFVNPSHMIVTGITQESGKTTTLEALILRSKAKAIIFKTKIGEKSFSAGSIVAPFFRERSDYEFVQSLIEAYSKTKLQIEKGTLMTLCSGSASLIEIKKRIDDKMNPADPKVKKPTGINAEIYIRLGHYLGELLPQIQYANFSSTLNISEGINIMDLEKFSEEAQSLIIRSVADEVLKNQRDTVIVIPEAWKFLPQTRNNPCKQAVESFIRQGATNSNYVWIDSQEMSSVDKKPLKQISTWILGFQRERNEVKHTLDQISLPKKSKPTEDDIMNLPVGHFFLSSREQVTKVYVQPIWLSNDDAIRISKNPDQVAEASFKKPLPSFNFPTKAAIPGADVSMPDTGSFVTKRELNQVRIDFFNKIQELVTDVNNYLSNFNESHKPQPKIDMDELSMMVLQKMPLPGKPTAMPSAAIDMEEVIEQVIARIPKSAGSVTYEVAPLEMIKKNFLIEIRNRIISDVSTLSADEKKSLRYLESKDSDILPNELVSKCLMLAAGGSSSTKASNIFKRLTTINVIEKTAGGRYRKGLRKRIESLMESHKATPQEIQNLYDHILMEII